MKTRSALAVLRVTLLLTVLPQLSTEPELYAQGEWPNMMMDPDLFADVLYATPPLEAVETRILEMLAAAGNEFIPLSVLHDASGLPHGPFFTTEGLTMIILDINIVSELMHPGPSSNVVDLVAGQAAPNPPTVNEAELLYSVETLPAGGRRDRLLDAVEGMTCADFDGRILPFDNAVARTCARAERLAAVRRPLRNTRSYRYPLPVYGALWASYEGESVPAS
jgi:predicted nucleic acid-binding protein